VVSRSILKLKNTKQENELKENKVPAIGKYYTISIFWSKWGKYKKENKLKKKDKPITFLISNVSNYLLD